MINPADIQNNIVIILRDIPELITLLGDMESIQAYDDESQVNGNPENAELSLLGKSLMVIWTGAELPREGEMRGWTHHFRIAVKGDSIMTCFSIAQTIIDGVPRSAPSISYPPFDDQPDGEYPVPIYPDGITQIFDDGLTLDGGYDGVTSFLNSTIHPECDGIQNVELSPNHKAGVFFIDFTITERA